MELKEFEKLLFDKIKEHIQKETLYFWDWRQMTFNFQIEVDKVLWIFVINCGYDGYTSDFTIVFHGQKENSDPVSHPDHDLITTRLEILLNNYFSS